MKLLNWIKHWLYSRDQVGIAQPSPLVDMPTKKYVDDAYTYKIIYTPGNKWQKVVQFFNDRDGVISRKALLSTIEGVEKSNRETQADQYRCYLERAGYLKKTGVGMYERVKYIPLDLTTKECRRQAYG